VDCNNNTWWKQLGLLCFIQLHKFCMTNYQHWTADIKEMQHSSIKSKLGASRKDEVSGWISLAGTCPLSSFQCYDADNSQKGNTACSKSAPVICNSSLLKQVCILYWPSYIRMQHIHLHVGSPPPGEWTRIHARWDIQRIYALCLTAFHWMRQAVASTARQSSSNQLDQVHMEHTYIHTYV